MLITVLPIYSRTFRSLIFLREADLGVLVTTSTLTTYIFSFVAYIFDMLDRPFADTLFETLGLLVTLIYIGRAVQVFARRAALSAMSSVGSVRSETANLVGENGQLTEGSSTIHPCMLHYDDIVRVSEDEVVPTDGVVMAGSAAIDEAAISGEVNPVFAVPDLQYSLVRRSKKVRSISSSPDLRVTIPSRLL